MQIARLLRTVAHLAPSQIWHRIRIDAQNAIWERMGSRIDSRYRDRAARLTPPNFDHAGLAALAVLRHRRGSDADRLDTARDAVEGRFSFNGTTLDLGREVAWFRPDLDQGTRLWKTMLHEFSYAIDLAVAGRQTGDAVFENRLCDLIDSWSTATPIGRPGFAIDVWDPRAVSTRLMNWSVAAALLEARPGSRLHTQLLEQLPLHALFLSENLELDLRANHLLRDYLALVLCDQLMGTAPTALECLHKEVDEQVLEDGCHFERSPLYHAVVLQDLLECRTLLGEETPAWLADAVSRLAGFLSYLLPPDGKLPLFGDTWNGDVDPGQLLEAVGEPITIPEPKDCAHSSGFVALVRGPVRALIATGPHGPDYQMGHAHADGLSFELYRGTQRVVTDTGTSTYDPGSRRERVRSTAAHNTVQIDGEEQLEAWGSFRVGRRGRGRAKTWGANDSWDWIIGTHDGYQWLDGNPMHERLLAVSKTAVWVIDRIAGTGGHEMRSAIHMHPDFPTEDVTVVALTGRAEKTPVELHERFNESRPMTEMSVEVRSALPWVGGWLLLFESTGVAQAEIVEEAGLVRATCRRGSTRMQLVWNVDTSGVEFE